MGPLRRTDVEQSWEEFDKILRNTKRASDPLDTHWHVYCDNCHVWDRFVEDIRQGALVCVQCGAVKRNHLVMPELADPLVHRRRSRTAPYFPPYHSNERFAAWFCTGPHVGAEDLARIRRYLGETPVRVTATGYKVDKRSLRRLDPLEMNSYHFRQVCTALKMRTHAERWVSIKQDLLGGHDKWKPRYPDPITMYRIQKRFALLVQSFNRLLYKKGKRRTRRDSVWGTEHPLSRHNLPHYNEIFHYLFEAEDEYLRILIDAEEYFPRVKTPGVRAKLRAMMEILFADQGWTVPDLD